MKLICAELRHAPRLATIYDFLDYGTGDQVHVLYDRTTDATCWEIDSLQLGPDGVTIISSWIAQRTSLNWSLVQSTIWVKTDDLPGCRVDFALPLMIIAEKQRGFDAINKACDVTIRFVRRNSEHYLPKAQLLQLPPGICHPSVN